MWQGSNKTYTIITTVMAISRAARNPPMNRAPPTAGDSDMAAALVEGISQSVQALLTVSCVPPTAIENGTWPMIRPAMIEAVSEPSSSEYSKVVA